MTTPTNPAPIPDDESGVAPVWDMLERVLTSLGNARLYAAAETPDAPQRVMPADEWRRLPASRRTTSASWIADGRLDINSRKVSVSVDVGVRCICIIAQLDGLSMHLVGVRGTMRLPESSQFCLFYVLDDEEAVRAKVKELVDSLQPRGEEEEEEER